MSRPEPVGTSQVARGPDRTPTLLLVRPASAVGLWNNHLEWVTDMVTFHSVLTALLVKACAGALASQHLQLVPSDGDGAAGPPGPRSAALNAHFELQIQGSF